MDIGESTGLLPRMIELIRDCRNEVESRGSSYRSPFAAYPFLRQMDILYDSDRIASCLQQIC